MAIPFHKDVTSAQALHATIMTDQYTYRWFTHLITRILKGDRSATIIRVINQNKYPALIQKQVFFCILTCLVTTASIVTRQYGGFILAGVFLVLYLRNQKTKREIVAKVGLDLVQHDFKEDEIGKKTLYQISEFYSEKYKIPSLVDAIYFLDQFYRFLLVGLLLFVIFVFPVPLLWQGLIFVMLVYFLVTNLVNLTFFYRKIK